MYVIVSIKVKDSNLHSVALLDGGVSMNYIQEGLIPSK